jgi:hypothetical protein
LSAHLWLGIDPGVSGGIAWIDQDDHAATRMPATPRDIYECIRDAVTDRPVYAAIEDLSGGAPRGPGGKALQTPKTMAVLHGNYGGLIMALTALQVHGERLSFEFVRPKAWRQRVGLSPSADAKQRKSDAKKLAQSLFPGLTVTLQIADSLLLAHYARKECP